MVLSALMVDTGDDPDRPRPGRLWLQNQYRVHQRLCMAFPSAGRQAEDAEFLQPYETASFGGRHVHTERSADAGFLYRVDPGSQGRTMVLVQSATEPDWDYAFRNAGHLLAAPPSVRRVHITPAAGERLRFRLLANATRKVDTKTGPDGVRRHGTRVPVPTEGVLPWLAGRMARRGITVEPGSVTSTVKYVYWNREAGSGGQRLFGVLYDGILSVEDPVAAVAAVQGGIGSAKGFGFGLLSVAPLRE